MLHYIVPHYAVLYCTILHSSILYSAVLSYALLYSTILYYTLVFHLLSVPKLKLMQGLILFSIIVPILWNSLPEHVKSSNVPSISIWELTFLDSLIPPKFPLDPNLCWWILHLTLTMRLPIPCTNYTTELD